MRPFTTPRLLVVLVSACTGSGFWHAETTASAELDGSFPNKSNASSPDDPFANMDHVPSSKRVFLTPAKGVEQPLASTPNLPSLLNLDTPDSPNERLFGDGFALKKELMLQVSRSSRAADAIGTHGDGWYSRSSIGFETLKKFSNQNATTAAFDLQMRLVRRDHFHEVLNDAEGADRRGWFLEYHNVYWDFYNVFNPFLEDAARSDTVGLFNLRIGRFYLPFGLNLQTDTHGSVLQLSNERNFGFERDWYTGFWGSLSKDLNYDLYYLLGSGYDIAFKGQSGLIGTRLSLSNKYLNEYGIEGGLSFLGGQRISDHALDRSPSVALNSRRDSIIDTLRYGGDLRWRHPVPTGSLTFTAEWSTGNDETDRVFTQLYQADYLTLNRKFGGSIQYRHFHQDIHGNPVAASMNMPGWNGGKSDASIVGDLTWYFRNDLGNSNLHWIKLCVERKTETMEGRPDSIITLQYYRYW